MKENALQSKRLFLLDMDGTIYLDDTLFDGTLDFLRHVRRSGGRYLFLTNNSSRGAQAYVEKMARLGIAAKKEDFLTSVDALIVYLQEHGYRGKKLYAFGTASFRAQLAQAGFSVTDRLSDDIAALVCGFDTELTFQKLEDACILLGRGADFLATNPDWLCPTAYGYVPDCGSVCQMLTRATGAQPVFVGKPQPDMVLLAMRRCGCRPEQTILVGDRLYTDIACGVRAGIDTALLLCGESRREDIAQSPEKPTYVFGTIGDLLDNLKGETDHEAGL